MEKIKVYISGPITGVDNARENFDKAQYFLESMGYHVVNPITMVDERPGMRWVDYMAIDVMLLSLCDEIYMLEGWEKSKGASIENSIAVAAGMVVSFE